MTTVTVTQNTTQRVTVTQPTVPTVSVTKLGPQGAQGYQGGIGAQGPQGEGVIFGTTEKKTGVDAGYLNEISITDDYIYVCVREGAVGVAIWKKALLFQT